jgi:hypothetical protein
MKRHQEKNASWGHRTGAWPIFQTPTQVDFWGTQDLKAHTQCVSPSTIIIRSSWINFRVVHYVVAILLSQNKYVREPWLPNVDSL